jgi:hypothetical protein
MGHGPHEGLSFGDQLDPLPVEHWCSLAQKERNEVDAYLVEQVCSEELTGDVGTQHEDVLVTSGVLGTPDRAL